MILDQDPLSPGRCLSCDARARREGGDGYSGGVVLVGCGGWTSGRAAAACAPGTRAPAALSWAGTA